MERSQLEALDEFDSVLSEADNNLTLRLEPGDMLAVNNSVVLHARSSFDETAAGRRRLFRVWLDRPT